MKNHIKRVIVSVFVLRTTAMLRHGNLNLCLYPYKRLLSLRATAKHPRFGSWTHAYAKIHKSTPVKQPDEHVFPTLSSILWSLDPIELLPLSLDRSAGEQRSQTNTDSDSRGFGEAFLDYILPER